MSNIFARRENLLEEDNKKAAIYREENRGHEIKIRLDLAESLLLRGASGMELNF